MKKEELVTDKILKLVENKLELQENSNIFNSYMNKKGTKEYKWALNLLRKGMCFLIIKKDEKYSFYTSRFIGYKGNTYLKHKEAKEKDGKETNSCLEKLLGSKFEEDKELERFYNEYLKEFIISPTKSKKKFILCDLELKSIELEENLTFESSVEGKPKLRYVTTYERNPKLRAEAIKIHGCFCAACGFDFERVYGELGKGYIHIHHKVPVSELEEPKEVEPRTDLIPLCANCHSIVHRKKKKTLSIKELKETLKK